MQGCRNQMSYRSQRQEYPGRYAHNVSDGRSPGLLLAVHAEVFMLLVESVVPPAHEMRRRGHCAGGRQYFSFSGVLLPSVGGLSQKRRGVPRASARGCLLLPPWPLGIRVRGVVL